MLKKLFVCMMMMCRFFWLVVCSCVFILMWMVFLWVIGCCDVFLCSSGKVLGLKL